MVCCSCDIVDSYKFYSQLLVSESMDSMGVATLTIERSTSTIGEVVVYWEVEDEGMDDLEPTSGNLTFADVSFLQYSTHHINA